ncbi:uncharacterized protein EI97DRAFT_183450 [Westerdykella ornata]|uniref:Cupredoxin n=1 Tax=Westerdykella ornata TaxID=318751 RepID=A0A6A6JST2_WESOR|nr:uncharacterized protein EI97DRAFT_183450 [Westerdykella ornata]KAF2279671.1 hypothetical protein EI97DRAFT_183450 [Westerdykella ornata]
MRHFYTVALGASLAAAEMQVMSLQPAAASGAATHTVVVGGLRPVETGMAPYLGYFPESITAAQGDVVKFIFMQKNHTVTQSTFENPCKAMPGGLDSGFKPNPEGKSGPEFEWEMTVPSTDPLWFYCKQRTGVHCGKGMVFSINAKTTGDKTMAQFKQLAIKTNGTEAAPLSKAPIQSVGNGVQAAPSTVTIVASGGNPTPPAHNTGLAPAPAASVVPGMGTDQNGGACTCHCLCGVNAFPAQAAINNFGGFAGSITNGRA